MQSRFKGGSQGAEERAGKPVTAMAVTTVTSAFSLWARQGAQHRGYPAGRKDLTMYIKHVVIDVFYQGQCYRGRAVVQPLCQLPAPHFQQVDVTVDLQRVDFTQLLKSVLVLQAVDTVYRNFEFSHVTVNYHLKGKHT